LNEAAGRQRPVPLCTAQHKKLALSKGLKIQHLGEFDFVYSQATPEAATTLVPSAKDVET